MHKHIVRVLGVDPTTRGFAYGLLEGPERLIDWGLVHVLIRTDRNILLRVEKIFDRTLPEVLVLEDGRGTRRGARAERLIDGIEEIANRRKLLVVRVSRSRVREKFAPAATKQEIAEGIARIFPELRSRLPRPRKPWMSEDERMSIFDALSFAIAALRA
ncbi:MAG TPA: hypothetical protein VGP73_18515 [Thermoanaerobaculia bacterium]